MLLAIALLLGRCTYSLGEKGYDLSRFRESPECVTAPDDLRGVVLTNGEAARRISAAHTGGALRFVVIGDTISDRNETFRTFLAEISDLNPRPSFVIHLGDRVVSPVVDYYGTYLKVIESPPCPILHVDGNHDVREEGDRISRAFFGERDFFFDLGDMRFVIMSNVHREEGFGFSREQLDWLEEKLEPPYPSRKFFFAHVPPKAPFKRITPGLASLFAPRLDNEDEFLDILSRHNVVMAAFGHRHIHASVVHDGVLMVITGGGGQRNFLEPSVEEPRFTKKNHYTLIDIPEAGPHMTLEGLLSCVGKGRETMFMTSFFQPSCFGNGGDAAVELRPSSGSGAGSS